MTPSRAPVTPSRSGDRLCVHIVDEIAAREGTAPTQLPTLATAIDPDSLGNVVDHASAPITVSFRYAGYEVKVSADGQVSIAEVNA